MFAVLVIEHRLWGPIFQPYFIEGSEDTFYTVGELITTKHPLLSSFSSEERTVVSMCDKYSESKLMKLFIREKMTVVEFLKKYENKSDDNYNLILSTVQRYNRQLAEYLFTVDLPIFLRKGVEKSIYSSDRIERSSTFLKPVASFEKLQEGNIHYSLKVYEDTKQIDLRYLSAKANAALLCVQPCCLVIHHHLCLFEKLDYRKLSPFIDKSYVNVPEASVATYMRTFVLNTLKAENIEAIGFDVIHDKYEVSPILILTEDLSKNPVLQLQFRYGDNESKIDEKSIRQVSLQETESNYIFHYYNRDIEKEKYYKEKLESIGFVMKNLFFYPNSKKDTNETESPYKLLDFLTNHKHELSDFEIRQDSSVDVYALEPIHLSLSLNEKEKDWFDIKGIVQIGEFTIPFYKFRKNIVSGSREYVLPDKRIAILPEEWFAKYSDLLRYSEENGENLCVRRYHFGIVDSALGIENKFQGVLDKLRDVPDGINAQLRSYQQVGYSWLLGLYENNFGGCLADDMGLGKTLQFLTFFQYIYHNNSPKYLSEDKAEKEPKTIWPYSSNQPSLFDQVPVNDVLPTVTKTEKKPASLVVLPTSLLFNWIKEKEKFAPQLLSMSYFGSKRLKTKNIGKLFDHYDIVFTSYGIMRNDTEFLQTYEFECIVLDESHAIKNPSSQNYRQLMELKAKHFYCISGTPIENSLIDLWAQMNFANRHILGTQEAFKKHYVSTANRGLSEEKEIRLQQHIKPFILRRTKAAVAKDLPPIIEQVVYCEMEDEQRTIYEREKSVVRNSLMDRILQDGIGKNTVLALSALLRLRQIANHPLLVFDEYKGNSSKMEEVVSRISDLQAEGHKVLIFSSFVKHLELLEKHLQTMQIKYSKLTGATRNREEEVNSFQTNKDISCFLISLKAGGVGLNLTAADYVFILDPWWNPAAEMQAVDRAHRIGQDKNIFVYRFIMKNTIEEKIQDLQREKRELAQTYINDNNPFADINVLDIEKLFS